MTDRHENIRRALAMGPTPGPWAAQIGARHIDVDADDWIITETDTHKSDSPPRAQCIANARLIAACDPDTIRALLEERDVLKAENARLRVALYELRERCAQECERLASSQCNTSIGEAWKLGALACADEIRAMTLANGDSHD